MRGSRAGAVAGVALVAALAGCTNPGAPSAPAPLPAGVRVDAEQYRSDRSAHALVIRVVNGSEVDLTVTDARFSSPAFVAPAVWAKRPTTVPAGVTRDLPVVLPDSDCEASPGHAFVALRFSLPDGRTGSARVEPGDPIGSLPKIVAEDCAGQAVSAVTALLGSALTVAGTGRDSVAHLTVSSSPSGAQGAVQLVRVDSTVLLESAAGGAWPLGIAIAGTDEPTAFDLAIVPNRCDPHAVAEDKVGTLLPIVAIDPAGKERRFPLRLADGLKDRLLQYVAATCGFGG